MTWSKRQKTYFVNLGFFLFACLILWAVYALWEIILPFFLALLLSYLLLPLVRWLMHKKIPLLAAVLIIYGIFGGFLYLLLFFGLPELLADVQQIIAVIPELSNQLGAWWLSFNENMQRFQLPQSFIDAISSSLVAGEMRLAKMAGEMVFSLFTFLKVFLSFLLAPILSYYMIRDAEAGKKKIISWLPPKHRPEILRISGDINHIIRQFLYGYFIVAMIVGFLTFVVLKVLGVKYAPLLGLLMGIADLIPYFGPFIGAVPAIILAYLDSFRLAVLTTIAIVLIQQLEGVVISPKIIGDRIGLHPLTIIFVVLVGGYWFGIWGMILAVPAAAALKLMLAFIYSCAVAWKEN